MSIVPNLSSALVDKLGKIIPPWNSFFQQFTAPAKSADIPSSPYTPNTQGNLIFTSPTAIHLIRGELDLSITASIIPLAVGDTATWAGSPTVYFLRTFSK